jgi:hypothetical protein
LFLLCLRLFDIYKKFIVHIVKITRCQGSLSFLAKNEKEINKYRDEMERGGEEVAFSLGLAWKRANWEQAKLTIINDTAKRR